ncbi:ubiquitin-associated 2-like protein [Dinothrombium tinctorium]|uniref:Ubiquitin-associated 2-like protein n=1 Tax=Dinothrombium tinctorium TaxID=1965070 RepID=A0A443RKE1_9ACAR|nr:ubiquitin-associated 2-like protein [Dinothrombium tinctorium]
MSTATTATSNKSSLPKTANKENKKGHSLSKNASNEAHVDSQQANIDGKLQPTAEQMRLANLMNDKTDLSEIKTKVDKIIELTGSSRDEAVVALHDCDGNLEKAIDMVLEGDTINESEWRSSGKKKKSKVNVAPTQQSQNEPEHTDKVVNGEKPKSNSRGGGKGGPRLQRGNNKNNWRSKEEKHPVNDSEHATTEDTTATANNPPKRNENKRGRGRGSKSGYGNKNDRGGRGTRTFQNRGYRGNVNDTFPNSIDTWTNSTADQSNNTNTVNNDCTTMTVGNWSDIAGNEDWSEEDWDSNVMETKVFTPSSKALSEKDELAEIGSSVTGGTSAQNISGLTALLQQKSGTESSSQQGISSIIGNNAARNSNTTSPGAALLQQLQQQSASSQPSQMNHYTLSQYSKQATESIKSLVGIPSSSSYSTSSSGLLSSGSNLDNQGSNITQVRTQQPQTATEQHVSGLVSTKPATRMSNKRSTKIPESAVEMPSNDSISSLNVQFGALEFGTDTSFSLSAETSNAFHEAVNHVTAKSGKGVTSGQSAAAAASNLNSSSLLSDNGYRNSSNTTDSSATKPQTSSSDIVLQSSVLGNQSMSADNVLDRSGKNTTSTSYGPKVLESAHNKTSLYHSVSSQVQPQTTNTSDISGYKSASYTQPDASTAYGSNMSYGGSTNAYIYPSTTNQGYSNVTNYSSNFSTGTPTVPIGGPSQKAGLKDLESNNAQQKHVYDLQTVGTPGASLGLVSNSTVTTNVLKNSLTATGKGIPNVPPGVTPLLGTQYIMGQAGLPAFYPVYDVQIPTAARDHNFAYTATSDVKYTRADNDGSNVVSTQAPNVSQTHTQPIFGQLPPGYGFFYTPGVNMMPQSLYGAAAPLFPVTPATNTHAGSAGSAFPKGTTGYGSHSYASAGYDSLTAVPQQDYVKQGYGPSGGQQGKGMSASNSDLSANQMYGKSHAQLTKNYEKAGFQTGTPPPFNMAAPQAGALGASYATTPSQYIQMLPQNQASMLHHTLQADGNPSGTGAVPGPRSMSQSQKGSASNSSKYYNNWA